MQIVCSARPARAQADGRGKPRPYRTRRAPTRSPHDLLQEVVDDVNRDRSRFEQVKRFVLLPRDFSMEHGEVTPTLKLRRRTVIEHFAAEVEDLYA